MACWVLLNGGNQDVVHDDAAYRELHRDLLVAYLDRYVIHAAVQAGSAAAPQR
jgi:hypothetical protein